MRRILAALLSCLIILTLFYFTFHMLSSTPLETISDEEIRAVWISYIDLSMAFRENNSESAYRQNVETILQTVASHKLNTVFLHVRPFSDAIYRSEIYPWSACISGNQGVDPGFDPLQIFCETANRFNVQVHAWINPFRICSDESKWETVSNNNPAKTILSDDDPDNDTAVVRAAGGIYFDPASPIAQKLILDGVRELLQNYTVAGIHIDDYYYPAQDASIDAAEYDAYLRQGGNMPLDAWRRNMVSTWIKRMYTAVKSFGEDKIFSISPTVNMSYNRDTLYADTALWCEHSGYCDWMIPQAYVGFEHETTPFTDMITQWNDLQFADNVRLLFGLAAYKCGQTDKYAGSGYAEWTQNNDILSRQITVCRGASHCSGLVFFSYSALFGENVSDNAKKELHFVTSVL